MKIDYKILWLDDQIREFVRDGLIDDVKSFLHRTGFRPIIHTARKASEFFEKLDNSYDLILTDYNMNEMNGKEVVEKIRSPEHSVSTEILFYTAKKEPLSDTVKISRVSFLETSAIGFNHQEILVEEIIGLIKLTILKFQDIVAMRGMVMQETSSLDASMLSIIQEYFKTHDSPEIEKYMFNKVIEFHKGKLDDTRGYLESNETEQILEKPYNFDIERRRKTLKKIIKKHKKEHDLEDFTDDYLQEIIQPRNRFAHAMLDTESRTFIGGSDDYVFNEDTCIQLRKDIIKHEENLRGLVEKLSLDLE